MSKNFKINKIFSTMFYFDNKSKTYYQPKNFWQKLLIALAYDRNTSIMTEKVKAGFISLPYFKTIPETPVEIRTNKAVKTTGATSVVLKGIFAR